MTSETHVNILNLGYLGVLVPDLAAWMKFGTEILGAEMSMSEDGTTGYMKIDGREWRVALHPGERGNVAYLGFEVQGPQELSHAEHVLKDHQIDFERIGGAEAGERRVAELIRLRDPNGNLVELFYGHNNDYSFRSPLGVSRFVTGDQGLGHAVVGVSDIDTVLDFYINVLGFKISDLAQQGRSVPASTRLPSSKSRRGVRPCCTTSCLKSANSTMSGRPTTACSTLRSRLP